MPRWLRALAALVVIAASVTVSMTLVVEADPTGTQTRSGSLLAGIGIGIAACIFLGDGLRALATLRTRRRGTRETR